MTTILFEIVRICCPRFKCNYLQNQKLFMILWFHFWNLHHILNNLKKKMIVIATLFRKLKTLKDLVRPLSKNHFQFQNTFDTLHVPNSCKTCERALSSYLSITLREPDLENISLSDMLTLRVVS